MFPFTKSKPKKPRSLTEIIDRLTPAGGLYRDPNDSLVAVWDKGESFIRIRPDRFTTHESLCFVSLKSRNVFSSHTETPIQWSAVKDLLGYVETPKHVCDAIVYAAERHGYAFSQPSQ